MWKSFSFYRGRLYLKDSGSFAFIEGLIFIGILMVGLAYVWKKGDLEWVKPEDLDALKE